MRKFKIKRYLKNFILAQLIITVVLIPILVHWGLELSLMSFVGNLIFTPFLALFLILSSLIFFTELFGIYNQPLIFLLNKTTWIWDYLLSSSSKDWLIGFTKIAIWPLLLITIATFYILKHKKINSFSKQVLTLNLSILLMFIYLKSWPAQTKKIPAFDSNLVISKKKSGGILLTDNGFFNKARNPEKTIEFDLKPFLVQNYSTSKVDNLTLNTASLKSFEGALQCGKILNLKKVTLPFFKTKLDKRGWRSFFLLRNFLKENNIDFLRRQT